MSDQAYVPHAERCDLCGRQVTSRYKVTVTFGPGYGETEETKRVEWWCSDCFFGLQEAHEATRDVDNVSEV